MTASYTLNIVVQSSSSSSSCKYSTGLRVNVSTPPADIPYAVFSSSSIDYNLSSFFTTSDSNCPIHNYECYKGASGSDSCTMPGSDEADFSSSTNNFSFSRTSSSRFAGTYTYRFIAVAGEAADEARAEITWTVTLQ